MNGSASACASEVCSRAGAPPPSPAPAIPVLSSFWRVTDQTGKWSCWPRKSSEHGNADRPSRWLQSYSQDEWVSTT